MTSRSCGSGRVESVWIYLCRKYESFHKYTQHVFAASRSLRFGCVCVCVWVLLLHGNRRTQTDWWLGASNFCDIMQIISVTIWIASWPRQRWLGIMRERERERTQIKMSGKGCLWLYPCCGQTAVHISCECAEPVGVFWCTFCNSCVCRVFRSTQTQTDTEKRTVWQNVDRSFDKISSFNYIRQRHWSFSKDKHVVLDLPTDVFFLCSCENDWVLYYV